MHTDSTVIQWRLAATERGDGQMSKSKKQQSKIFIKMRALFLVLCIAAGVGALAVYAEGESESNPVTEEIRKLQNGSFEINTDGDLFKAKLTFDVVN